MKKRLLSVVAALVTALSLLTACGGGAASTASTGETASTASTAAGNTGDKIVMKISHVSSPGSARDLACQKLAEVVEEMTRDQVEGAQFGTIECGVVPTSYLGGTVPMLTLLDTPICCRKTPNSCLTCISPTPSRRSWTPPRKRAF